MELQHNLERGSIRHKLLMLLGGASAMSLMTAAPAFAQDDEDDDDEDTIVVQGIRKSLQNAQDIRRDADTFVDAVTAEDIGALPDRSVTEALQRVPGITISRFAAADDPDHFSIEGQGVVVRGLTYVRSELNGRDTFSANNGRALSFADVPAELLGSVQVFKNQSADLIEGGIAGSINLVTRKPFDSSGQTIAGSLEYNYADLREEGAPTFSGLYSNSWDGDFGRFGILVNGVTSELKTRSDSTQISSFQGRDDLAPGTVFSPEGAVVRTQDYDRERIGYGGSVQWENPERTLLATAEFLRSESTVAWTEHVSEIATDNVGDNAFFFLPGTQFAFGSDSLFTNGSISAPIGWRADQNGDDPRTPIYGLQSNNIFRGVEQEYATQDASLNVKWTPTERFSFNFDYHHIDSTVENVDNTVWGTTFQDLALDLNQDVPDVVYLAPNETGDGTATNPPYDCSGGPGANCPTYFDAPNDSFADPYNSFWRAAMDHMEDSEGTEDAFRADMEYDFQDDLGWLKSMRVGARWSNRDQTTRFSTYNWGALSEIWGNGGPIWFDEVGVPEGLVSNFEWDNYHRGDVTQPPAFPYFNLNPAADYEATADFADSVVAAWLAQGNVTGGPTGGGGGWRRLSERPGVVPGTPYLPGEINDAEEKNTAYYVRFDYGWDDIGNGMSLDGNFGVRYFRTDFSSVGAFQFPEASSIPIDTGLPPSDDPNVAGGQNQCLPPVLDPNAPPPDDPYVPPFFCGLPQAERDAIRAFSNGASTPITTTNKYDMFLPSFNAKLGLNDDMLLRFAYSKSISRPDFGLQRAFFTLAPNFGADDPRTVETEETPSGFRAGTGFQGFTSSGGNPFLNPIVADQFDVAFEWYFADVGSITVTAFYKEIDDIVLTGQGDLTFSNNGVTRDDVFTRQPTNSDDTGKIKGFEIAYQQFYDFLPSPFDGIGVQASYTFIDSDGVQSSGVSNTSTTPAANDALVDLSNFPLQGCRRIRSMRP